MPSFGQWTYTVDRQATAKAYAEAEIGGADSCDCAYCRNFRVARPMVFPKPFLALLDELGIDPRKDAEVFEYCSMGPGLRHYGGWYHFIGKLEEENDLGWVELVPGFSVGFFHDIGAPRLPIFDGAPKVQINFQAKSVPWLLAEPEPD